MDERPVLQSGSFSYGNSGRQREFHLIREHRAAFVCVRAQSLRVNKI